MQIKVYRPQHKVLEELIDCFYILRRRADEAPTCYITFPSIFTVVSLAWGVDADWKGEKIRLVRSDSRELMSGLVSRFKKPMSVEYACAIEEITIYFKPLGINVLLDKPLNSYEDNTEFFPFPDLEKAMKTVFKNKNDLDKIDQLETYLLTKYKGFDDRFLTELIRDLSDETAFQQPVSELCKKYGISNKNLLKHFARHTCKTPLQFRKIVRFRTALKKYRENPTALSLTELTYILQYFDQSHLIKDFRLLTGYSPRTFFKNLTPLEQGKINWMFSQG